MRSGHFGPFYIPFCVCHSLKQSLLATKHKGTSHVEQPTGVFLWQSVQSRLLTLLSAGEGVGQMIVSFWGSLSTSLNSDCDLQNTMQCTNVTKYNEKIYKCNSMGCYLHRKQINTDIWYYILLKNITKITVHKQNNWIGGIFPVSGQWKRSSSICLQAW